MYSLFVFIWYNFVIASPEWWNAHTIFRNSIPSDFTMNQQKKMLLSVFVVFLLHLRKKKLLIRIRLFRFHVMFTNKFHKINVIWLVSFSQSYNYKSYTKSLVFFLHLVEEIFSSMSVMSMSLAVCLSRKRNFFFSQQWRPTNSSLTTERMCCCRLLVWLLFFFLYTLHMSVFYCLYPTFLHVYTIHLLLCHSQILKLICMYVWFAYMKCLCMCILLFSCSIGAAIKISKQTYECYQTIVNRKEMNRCVLFFLRLNVVSELRTEFHLTLLCMWIDFDCVNVWIHWKASARNGSNFFFLDSISNVCNAWNPAFIFYSYCPCVFSSSTLWWMCMFLNI